MGAHLGSAYVYIRFSDPSQEKGDSRERQTRDNLAFCARKGWTVIDTFGDYGKSAWHGHHLKDGELGKFAERVRRGEIPRGTILVCEKLDRLSRLDIFETQDWLREMTGLGLCIATQIDGQFYDQNTFTSTNPNVLMQSIQVLLETHAAKVYSDTISHRVKGSWERRREAAKASKKITSAHAPGWLRVVEENGERRFEEIPERGDVVRLIYQLAADGVGSRAIARTLNERGYKPWGREFHHRKSGKVGWEHTYVADILRSPAPEGDYMPGVGRRSYKQLTGDRIVGYFPVIVDADLVARARLAIEGRKGTGGRNKVTRLSNLFTGLCYCTHCVGKMRLAGNSKKPARYLICQNAATGRGCHQKKMFAYKPFEEAALREMLHLALDDRFFQQPDQTHALMVKIAEAKKALTIKQDGAKNLGRAIAAQPSETLMGLLTEAEAEIATLRDQIEGLERALAEARGSVSPQEHARRVLEVRGALDHPDYETRLTARRKVSEAIRGVVDNVRFCVRDDGSKIIEVHMIGGAHVLRFDNAGNKLLELRPAAEATADGFMVGDDRKDVRTQAYFRRRAS